MECGRTRAIALRSSADQESIRSATDRTSFIILCGPEGEALLEPAFRLCKYEVNIPTAKSEGFGVADHGQASVRSFHRTITFQIIGLAIYAFPKLGTSG